MEIILLAHQPCFVVLQPVGQIDTVTAEQVQAALQAQLRPTRFYLIVDLSRTTYINSAGLRVFLATLQTMRQRQGDLLLAAVNRQVHRVLEMSGFTELLRIYPSVAAACTVVNEECQ